MVRAETSEDSTWLLSCGYLMGRLSIVDNVGNFWKSEQTLIQIQAPASPKGGTDPSELSFIHPNGDFGCERGPRPTHIPTRSPRVTQSATVGFPYACLCGCLLDALCAEYIQYASHKERTACWLIRRPMFASGRSKSVAPEVLIIVDVRPAKRLEGYGARSWLKAHLKHTHPIFCSAFQNLSLESSLFSLPKYSLGDSLTMLTRLSRTQGDVYCKSVSPVVQGA